MILLLCTSALAATVEVSPGDDVAAVTSALAAGDEIIFTDGTYSLTDDLYWTGTGTADSPIVLRAADGASPILELGPTEEGGWAGQVAYIENSAFIEIRGLHFRGGDGWDDEGRSHHGVVVRESSDITLSDVEISRTGHHGLILSGNTTRFTGERLHIHDTLDGDGISAGCGDASCFTVEPTITGSWIHAINGQRHGLYFAHGVQGGSFTDNVIYDAEYRGAFLGSAELGEPNVFERNAIWSVGGRGLSLYGASRVRNNIVFLTGEEGIFSGDPDRDGYQDVVITYNTVVDTGEWALELDDWTGRSGMVLSSNALCNPVGEGVSVEREELDTGVTELDALITSNVVCGYVEGLTEDEGHLVPGSGWADYQDVDGWDLYPTDDSTLRDVGDPSGDAWVPTTDFNGVERPGDAPDVGAYEWVGSGNPGWVVQEGFKSTDPVVVGSGSDVIGGCGCKGKDKDAGDTGAALLLLPLGGLFGLRRRRK